MITPKGLTVIQSPRVEAMTMRVAAKTPGIAPRVRDDLAKFNFQRVESSDDSAVVVTTSARHIPEKLTVHLPVTGAEYARFLNPTARINSKTRKSSRSPNRLRATTKTAQRRAQDRRMDVQQPEVEKVESDAADTLASREADAWSIQIIRRSGARAGIACASSDGRGFERRFVRRARLG